MRTPRPLAFVLVGLAAVLSGRTLAQSDSVSAGASNPTEQPEEITVRGRKTLEQFRLELAAAREGIVEAYNAANSSDANDITCRNERATGTRMPQRVCRSKAQSEAEASASRDLLRAFTHNSGGFRAPAGTVVAGGAQVNASIGAAAAQSGAELLSAESRAAIEAELETLKKENRQVYRAIVKYLEVEDEYNRARGVTAEQ
jgi:hypothetical protein